jgi:hypothetical protein
MREIAHAAQVFLNCSVCRALIYPLTSHARSGSIEMLNRAVYLLRASK